MSGWRFKPGCPRSQSSPLTPTPDWLCIWLGSLLLSLITCWYCLYPVPSIPLCYIWRQRKNRFLPTSHSLCSFSLQQKISTHRETQMGRFKQNQPWLVHSLLTLIVSVHMDKLRATQKYWGNVMNCYYVSVRVSFKGSTIYFINLLSGIEGFYRNSAIGKVHTYSDIITRHWF